MSFKAMVESDLKNVFLNSDEFAELHDVVYDGVTYKDISIALSGIKEKDRRQLVSDHLSGLHLATDVMYCAKADLNGIVPEKDTRIKINDEDYMREFYVSMSSCAMGMIRLELEAIDE